MISKSVPPRVAAARDVWSVEFQGSVVKTRFTATSRATPGPDDAHWFPRAHQQLFHQLVSSYPRELRQRLPDGSFTVQLSDERWAELELEAWALARELKTKFYSRGRRGQITSFSRKSRKRLLELGARLQDDVEGLFLTLTYRQNMTDAVKAKHHLDLMLRWLRYHRPGCSVVWRMDFQERGAIHFHLLILGTDWIRVRGIRSYWEALIDDTRVCPEPLSFATATAGNVDIERIHNRRKALSYISKYIANPVEHPPAPQAQVLRLDYLPYSENGETVPAGGDAAGDEKADNAFPWVGRFWGVVGRKFLPLGELVKFEFVGSPAALLDFRRAARRYKPGLFRRTAIQGFTLFVRDVQRWLKLWYCCEGGRSLLAHVISGQQTAFQLARGGPQLAFAPARS